MKINGFCFKSPSLWSFVTVAIGQQHTPPPCGLSPHRRSEDFLFHNDPSAVGSLNQEARQPDQLQPLPLESRATLQTVSQLLCTSSSPTRSHPKGVSPTTAVRTHAETVPAHRPSEGLHDHLCSGKKSRLRRMETVPSLPTTHPEPPAAPGCWASALFGE